MITGMLQDFVSETEIDSWIHILKSVPGITIKQNECHGVDENNVNAFWFNRVIFQRVQAQFGQDLFLQFGMFLNETKPWGIHTDSYHTQLFADRQAAISFLLPYSVDHDKDLVNQSHTIIFNEHGDKNDGMSSLPDRSEDLSCATSIFQTHLSHNALETVKKMTVREICQWHRGNIIYWDSNLYHDSDNFLANGWTSKQAIVIHTYRKL